MITEEHFAALREIKQSAKDLILTCTELAGPAAIVHVAFDRDIAESPLPGERDLLAKISSLR